MIPEKTDFLHFVGIGGIGMSGIALMLRALGWRVQGSDLAPAPHLLAEAGIRTFVGHAAEQIRDSAHAPPAAVVVSSAIKPNNPELRAARAARVPVVRRADMLAELMRHKKTVVVGGTHGKTTTTALTAHLLAAGGLDPTVVNGGIVNAYGTNARLGAGEWMVVESDESDGSFTRLPARVAVVTNMDPEHLEYYGGDFARLRAAFRAFVEAVPFYGYAVLCADHPQVRALAAEVTDRRVFTYALDSRAETVGQNVRLGADASVFDVQFQNGTVWRDMRLSMPGRHNVQNALAAVVVAHQEGVSEKAIRDGLFSFSGVKRRFTITGEHRGVRVVDDYAHHPVEIAATLATARMAVGQSGPGAQRGRVVAVVQPHRYTRLRDNFPAFCACFGQADAVLVAPVYAASEAPIDGMDREALVAGIKATGHPNVRAVEGGARALAPVIAEAADPGDMVVVMGAGDCTAWAAALPEALARVAH
ncbi:MAG TPA: UDP-N-acetylmuramate--L-alanine ligase [Rhodospirillaceae bacterium]|nr:UDP-N-acetylmuramate--L-alanine ligase [Alphaproteobacteria bacterium]HBH26636.1 UDP-N-acetylmuramate--L-alanine ligase [Rhodospirillaceae bacterium]